MLRHKTTYLPISARRSGLLRVKTCPAIIVSRVKTIITTGKITELNSNVGVVNLNVGIPKGLFLANSEGTRVNVGVGANVGANVGLGTNEGLGAGTTVNVAVSGTK
jgi:hypothetical protein